MARKSIMIGLLEVSGWMIPYCNGYHPKVKRGCVDDTLGGIGVKVTISGGGLATLPNSDGKTVTS